MSDLKRTLADLAERGTPIGADRLRDRVMLDLAPGSSSTPWSRVDARRPAFVILGAVAATLLLVGAVPLLFGWMGTSGSETVSATTVVVPEPIPPVVGVGDSQTVSVTVTGVSGYVGHQLAGVLYAGGDLTDLDRDALGGFWSVVDSGDFTTTEAVLEPGEPGMGLFPHVTDHTLAVSPGIYTLVVWVDLGLGGMSRWVPVNSDGMGLYGCQAVFEVADDAQTDVAITANLVADGWNTDCTTGIAIPGTDAAAAVAPDDEMWWPELEMSMPPVVGEGDGQTVSVTVSGVTGHDGDELAGVLYSGGELTDLDSDALGGFWVVVDGDEAAATEVVREPGTVGEGRFPFIASQALTVAPGTYTLVVWVDLGLGGMSRWVPVNSDGMGLYGCQTVFEVGDDAQTDVAITANLVPDGWNTDCTTGIAIPGTDAAAAVAPIMSPDEVWMPSLDTEAVERTGSDVLDTPPIKAKWTLVATVDGWLTGPVFHNGGFLAMHKGLDKDAEPNAEGHVEGWINPDLGGQLWESTDGVTWIPAGDDQELPPPPTGESENGASVIVEIRREPDGPNRVTKHLLSTSDGSAWREVNLRPYDDNWVPRVAEGGLGWLVYSPPMAEGANESTGWSGPRDSNHGLWYTPDTEGWFEVADLGPLGNYGNVGEIGVLDAAMIVRDDDILVFTLFAENIGFGTVSQLRTEVWQLGLDT